mmetsp:Transcript_39897/g.96309  ORF Transcript_39897/g.96309 Transcript_39897/m.96309 type:complete len:211 (+) Transcript_39897:76-708(+)
MVLENASWLEQVSSHTGMLLQPFFLNELRPYSCSILHRKGNPAQSATVTSFPVTNGPSINASNSCSFFHILLFSPPRTALFPTGKNSRKVFRNATILLFITPSSSSCPGINNTDDCFPSLLVVETTVDISSRIRSESARTVLSLLLRPNTKIGTWPFGFRSQNQSGLPPGPYNETCSILYGTFEASMQIHAFCANGHILFVINRQVSVLA